MNFLRVTRGFQRERQEIRQRMRGPREFTGPKRVVRFWEGDFHGSFTVSLPSPSSPLSLSASRRKVATGIRKIKIKRWTGTASEDVRVARTRNSASLLYEVDAYVYCRSIISSVNHSLLAEGTSCSFPSAAASRNDFSRSPTSAPMTLYFIASSRNKSFTQSRCWYKMNVWRMIWYSIG